MKKMIDEKVRVTTLVRATPERVYDAIAMAEGVNAWFTTDALIDARPGGKIQLHWKDWGHSRYTGENGGDEIPG